MSVDGPFGVADAVAVSDSAPPVIVALLTVIEADGFAVKRKFVLNRLSKAVSVTEPCAVPTVSRVSIVTSSTSMFSASTVRSTFGKTRSVVNWTVSLPPLPRIVSEPPEAGMVMSCRSMSRESTVTSPVPESCSMVIVSSQRIGTSQSLASTVTFVVPVIVTGSRPS